MKYYVTIKVDARYSTEVEADSAENAKEKAIVNWMEADIGELEDTDGEVCIIEDENENILFEA